MDQTSSQSSSTAATHGTASPGVSRVPAASPTPFGGAEAIAEVKRVFALQQAHRWTLARTTAAERVERLQRLRAAILAERGALARAVELDFRKHDAEFELTEIVPTIQELQHTVGHLAEWLEPRPVRTPLTLMGTRSELRYEPRGVVCILAPWNYPVHLVFAPLIAAVASGNCVIVRPSEKVPNTGEVIQRIIRSAFDEREVACFTGDVEVADALLDLPFDHFFFTGSTRVGRKVMAKAAEHLASVTLELGGKSPAIIDETADIVAAAERIVWGKFLNAGQTCVAPDYAIVHEGVRDAFIEKLKQAVQRSYGPTEEARKASPDLARMVDLSSFKRVKGLVEETVAMGARVELGAQSDPEERYIAPTILSGVAPSAPIMREEIFGPVLPVLTFSNLEEVFSLVHRTGKPLAMYVFSSKPARVEQVLQNTTAGGTLINNVLAHLANPELPFGGVGESGQGSYHGEAGIRAFSHERSIMRQGRLAALRFIYPPYTSRTRRVIAWFGKLAG